MPHRYKSAFRIFLRCQNACSGAIYLGYTLSEMCISMNHLMSLYKFDIFEPDGSPTEFSRYMSIVLGPILCFGGMAGSYFCPMIVHSMERRQLMMIADVIFIIAAVLTQINHWEAFTTARILMGIACGLDLTSIPLYVREVSPDSLSGHTGSIMQANISLGLFLGFIITMPLTNITENNQSADGLWRLVFLIPIVFSLLRITSFLLIYKKDTPYFYFSQRRIAEGRAALEEIYLPEFVFDQEKLLLLPGISDFPQEQKEKRAADRAKRKAKSFTEGTQLKKSMNGSHHQNQNSISKSEEDLREELDKCAPLLSDDEQTAGDVLHTDHKISYRRRLRIGVVINFMQQMTGCNGLVAGSPTLLGLLTNDNEMVRCLMIGNAVFLFFVSMLGVLFNRHLARKKYIAGGFFFCSVLLLALTALCYDSSALIDSPTLQFLVMTVLFSFFAVYNFTVGPVTSILSSDILKDKGMSVSVAANWLGTFVSIGLTIMDHDFYINVVVYTVCAFIGFLFSAVFIIETYWLNFTDIVSLYGTKETKTALALLHQMNTSNGRQLSISTRQGSIQRKTSAPTLPTLKFLKIQQSASEQRDSRGNTSDIRVNYSDPRNTSDSQSSETV